MKKYISALLLVAMMLALPACANDSDSTETTAAPTTAAPTTDDCVVTLESMVPSPSTPEPHYLDTLPATTFEGDTFVIMGLDYETRRNFADANQTGELVNDALFKRDLAIEERYLIDIQTTSIPNGGDFLGPLQKSVQANDEPYDLVMAAISNDLKNALNQKLLYNLLDLPHLQLDKGWWSKGMHETTAAYGAQYITMGDISPMKYSAPFCLAFNQRLVKDEGLGDMYQLVLDGKWTLDKFDELTANLDRDLNGDTVMNEEDYFGYNYVPSGITAWAHYCAMGQTLSTVEQDEIVVNLGTETSINLVERLMKFFETRPVGLKSPDHFKAGKSVFYSNSYSGMLSGFRDMVDNYGILPTPKLDEAQENYVSFVNTYITCGVAAPVNIDNPEKVGLIAEAMCYLSYETVRPAVHETAKVKAARDERTADMLDIIFDSTYIDYNGMMNFGDSSKVIQNSVFGDDNPVSGFERVKKSTEVAIKTFAKMLGAEATK